MYTHVCIQLHIFTHIYTYTYRYNADVSIKDLEAMDVLLQDMDGARPAGCFTLERQVPHNTRAERLCKLLQ